MKIKIETEKTVVRGVPHRKIIKTEGVLKYDELPREYVEQGKLHCYGSELCFYPPGTIQIVMEDNNERYLKVSSIIDEKEFQEKLLLISKAGERLHEINKKVKILTEAWRGTETFVV
jgi:hypothetical protein